MTITQETINKTCSKCKHVETKYIARIQKCDFCGKTEKYPRDSEQYTSDFYGVDVFPVDHGSDHSLGFSFCSPEHMFAFIIQYRKPFGFMTLPYIHCSTRGVEGRKSCLYIRDLRRLFKH